MLALHNQILALHHLPTLIQGFLPSRLQPLILPVVLPPLRHKDRIPQTHSLLDLVHLQQQPMPRRVGSDKLLPLKDLEALDSINLLKVGLDHLVSSSLSSSLNSNLLSEM